MNAKMKATEARRRSTPITETRFISYEPRQVPRLVRLSDPEMREHMDKTIARLTRSKKAALAFLVEIGIATPTGRLSKRYR
jgi:hypothetical protein